MKVRSGLPYVSFTMKDRRFPIQASLPYASLALQDKRESRGPAPLVTGPENELLQITIIARPAQTMKEGGGHKESIKG